jgi:hypothetical protein
MADCVLRICLIPFPVSYFCLPALKCHPAAAGIAARVRAIDDAFFLEEFSSKALQFSPKKNPVQPITWTPKCMIDSHGSSESVHSIADVIDVDFDVGDDDKVDKDCEAGGVRASRVRAAGGATPPGSPILTVSADELSVDTPSPTRSRSTLSVDESAGLAPKESVSTATRTRPGCMPVRKKSTLTERMTAAPAITLDSRMGDRSERARPPVRVRASPLGEDTDGSIGGGIPRRLSRGIRRVLGRRESSSPPTALKSSGPASAVNDIHLDPYAGAGSTRNGERDILLDPAIPLDPLYWNLDGSSLERDRPILWFSGSPGEATDTLVTAQSSTHSNPVYSPRRAAELGMEFPHAYLYDDPTCSPSPSNMSISTVFGAGAQNHQSDRQDKGKNRSSAPYGSSPVVAVSPRADSDSTRVRIAQRGVRDPAPRASSAMAEGGYGPRRVSRMGIGFRRREIQASPSRNRDDYISFSVTSTPVRERRRPRRWF